MESSNIYSNQLESLWKHRPLLQKKIRQSVRHTKKRNRFLGLEETVHFLGFNINGQIICVNDKVKLL